MAVAICPGSFDPFTNGHLDIVTRAADVFGEVIVLLLIHPSKNPTFSTEQRLEFIKKSVSHLGNVTAEFYEGSLSDYAASKNVHAVVKGLRAVSDFEYEFQMALVNKKLNPELETFFITTKAEYMFISSSIVRQVASLGKSVKDFVPQPIYRDIETILGGKEYEH